MKAAGHNLPHMGHPEVDDWVKVFFPIQGAMLGTAPTALGTHQHDAITAGTPAGTNAASAVTGSLNIGTPALTGTGITAVGQVMTTTDNQTVTENQFRGCWLYSVTGANPPVLILSHPAATGAPVAFTVQGAAFTDAGAYYVVSFAGTAAAQAFSGSALGTHQHPAVTAGTPTVALKAVGAGDPPVSEVSTFGFSAVQMEAAGDDCRLLIPVPDNMAVSQQMKISIAWSTDNVVTTNTATWKALFKAIAAGEALAAPTSALDTAITADAVDDTAYGFQETPQGVINGATFEKGDIIALLLELDAVSGLNPAADKVYCHGVFIEYLREQL